MERFVIQALIKHKKINEDSKYHAHNYVVCLPINKIDGISVDVTLSLVCDNWVGDEKDRFYRWAIIISSPIYLDEDGGEYEFYREFQDPKDFKFKKTEIKKLTESVTELITKVKSLRLDNLNGIFKTQLDDRRVLCTEVYNLFKDEEHIELYIKECSVCYTPTKTKTECNHSICWTCIQKSPKFEDDDNDCRYISCPMCRQCVGEIH